MLVDLRSDTLTKPTLAMPDAMISAEVCDDVCGEDPTVRARELQVPESAERRDEVLQAYFSSAIYHAVPTKESCRLYR